MIELFISKNMASLTELSEGEFRCYKYGTPNAVEGR